MNKFILPTAAVATLILSAGGVVGQEIVRIVSPAAVTTLDPVGSAASGNIEALGQLYSRLLRRNEEGELEPGLAES